MSRPNKPSKDQAENVTPGDTVDGQGHIVNDADETSDARITTLEQRVLILEMLLDPDCNACDHAKSGLPGGTHKCADCIGYLGASPGRRSHWAGKEPQ